MKVLDLACVQAHVFEGWFASEADFLDQRTRGLVECPCCGDRQIEKRLSAPRLNLGRSGPEPVESAVKPAPSGSAPQAAPGGLPAHLQAAWWQAMREVAARTEDVGERFAEEARRMHHGEAERRDIRGRASGAQALELLEEGIAVLPLPDLPVFDGPLQ